jgi:hypothetical protein
MYLSSFLSIADLKTVVEPKFSVDGMEEITVRTWDTSRRPRC